ncbi:MAG: TIGR01777 family oxidoreductase [Acidimicrobiales bacterium]|nr:TIGR01777 family oxidoreductase [Actinomycetota bacterium]
MRVIVTGSHGLIGGELARRLEQDGHQVTRLVRGLPGPGEAGWDPKEGTADAAALEGHDAAVHLAGAGLGDHRWTDAYKAEVLRSRVDGTTLLARALAGLDRPPTVMASGSAVGFYGDRGDEELSEESGPGSGFLADVVQKWEAATAPAEEAGIRVVHLRSGIVQTAKGGALKQLLLPYKLGLGGRLGSGRQWLSWVSLHDEVGAIGHVLQDEALRGPVNLTAPVPVTHADYARAVGRALHRPAAIPTPTLALNVKLGREMVREMVLSGQRVLPARLLASGFRHRHPDLDAALAEELGRPAA